MKVIFKITAMALITFTIACKPTQKITYNIDKYQPVSESVNVSLSVQTFQDVRQEFPDNLLFLQTKGVVATVDQNKSCINAESLYKIPVGQQMAEIFGKYLGKRAYFTNVLVNNKEQADYYLTAKVKQFTGHQKYSNKAAVGSQFGLIGALATMSLKTEGKIIIELSDICLYDKNDNLVATIGDFKKEFEGDFPVNATCYCIYSNVNLSLAEFNEELGSVLFREIKKMR